MPERAPGEAPAVPPLPSDLGLEAKRYLAPGLGVALVFYLLGWAFEDTQFLLADRAVLLWAVATPLWLCALGGALRLRPGTAWRVALCLALCILALHLGILALVHGRLNDDAVGIAAAMAAAATGGWILGRVLHRTVRHLARP
jgi:hypothetical protein